MADRDVPAGLAEGSQDVADDVVFAPVQTRGLGVHGHYVRVAYGAESLLEADAVGRYVKPKVTVL